jgi:DNA replication protein DnaC
MSDLYVESENFRLIYDNYEMREQAEKIFEETGDVKKVDDFCKSLFLKKRAEGLLKNSKIDKRFSLRTFDNFKCYDGITKTAKKKAQEYAENIKDYLDKGTNLIIEGTDHVGTGKTHLACAIAQDVMQRGIPAKFINVISMIAEIKENFDIAKYTDIELLIIDDLGKEKGTDWVCETIYAIINKRYEQMKPTVITTEKSMQDMAKNYGDKGKAIISRISEDFYLIRLNGDDYRLKRGDK